MAGATVQKNNMYIAVLLLILSVTCFEVYLIHGIVRSILKKPLNYMPSERKWVCIHAKLVSEESISYVNIKPYSKVHKIKYTVQYEYNGCFYTGKIDGRTLKGRKAVIYCRKDNPAVIKEYVPQNFWSMEVILSVIFIVGFLFVCEAVVFTQLIIK